MSVFDFVRLYRTLFDFVRLCSTLFVYTGTVRICLTLFDFTENCSTLFNFNGNFSLLPGFSFARAALRIQLSLSYGFYYSN